MRDLIKLVEGISFEPETSPVEAPKKPVETRKVVSETKNKTRSSIPAEPVSVSETVDMTVLKAHPEFGLLVESLRPFGKDGPEHGSVAYFIAEAYARELSQHTGITHNKVLAEAYLDVFDRPSPYERQREKRNSNRQDLKDKIAATKAMIAAKTAPKEDMIVPQQMVSEEISEDSEEGPALWEGGSACVHQKGDRFVVYWNDKPISDFPDEESAIAFGEHILSDRDVLNQQSRYANDLNENTETSEEVLAEARKFAMLAGIGAKPKKVEATGDLADILTLAGIR